LTVAAVEHRANGGRVPGGLRLSRRSWNLIVLFPAVFLVAVLLVLPMCWLLGTSLFGEAGLTLANYARLAQPAYVATMVTTLKLAAVTTIACVVLGYPTAFAMAEWSSRWSTVILICVILPFWTSVLVRTYAWTILLGRRGPINTLLLNLGLIDSPLQIARSFEGTAIAMVHILLPVFVLPLYAALSKLDRTLVRAAASCGAGALRIFLDIRLPLALPGLIAGATMVFVLSLGFFITPAVMGGGRVITWSMLIDQSLLTHPDWGMAAALGVVLLLTTFCLLAALRRLLGSSWRA
jgi:ABC-type spermidine/putrescine transport system permease subunit I